MNLYILNDVVLLIKYRLSCLLSLLPSPISVFFPLQL